MLRTLLLCLAPCLSLGLSGAAAAPAMAVDDTPAMRGFSRIGLVRAKTGHLLLHARINGVGGRFVLDTGAGRSVIEAARQAKFRLTTPDRLQSVAIGAGGSVPLRMSHGNVLEIGGFKDQAFTAYLMPLEHVNLAFLRRGLDRIDGVIGADVLREGQAVIDYGSATLYLRPRQAAGAAPDPSRQPEPTSP